jgi:hypothetical protein
MVFCEKESELHQGLVDLAHPEYQIAGYKGGILTWRLKIAGFLRGSLPCPNAGMHR